MEYSQYRLLKEALTALICEGKLSPIEDMLLYYVIVGNAQKAAAYGRHLGLRSPFDARQKDNIPVTDFKSGTC